MCLFPWFELTTAVSGSLIGSKHTSYDLAYGICFFSKVKTKYVHSDVFHVFLFPWLELTAAISGYLALFLEGKYASWWPYIHIRSAFFKTENSMCILIHFSSLNDSNPLRTAYLLFIGCTYTSWWPCILDLSPSKLNIQCAFWFISHLVSMIRIYCGLAFCSL